MTLATPIAEASLPSEAPRVLVATSPATGRRLTEVPAMTPAEAVQCLEVARRAQPDWFATGLRYRIETLHRLKHALRRHMDAIIGSVVAEQGRAPYEVLAEFFASIEFVPYYARIAPSALAPQPIFTNLDPQHVHWTERRPHGVELLISPWNFPLYLTIPNIVAALVTGNTVIHKPSEYAIEVADLIAKCVYEAGVPREVYQVVHGRGDVGAALVQAEPNHITFVGSVPTGRKIAALAGEKLIPVTLELGSKDAAIVLEDADLDRTARGIVWSAMFNSGQTCVSLERLYVARPILEPLVEKMRAAIDRYIRVGPGEAFGTTMGALTTEAQLRVVDGQVREALDAGATAVIGGAPLPEGSGRLYPPTILTGVNHSMRVMQEETFGPVLGVMPFDTEDEAIQLANDSIYGLTGSIWTRNRARGLALASRMEAGHVAVNDHIVSMASPNLPWGGIKASGSGRMHGVHGLHEVTWIKTISVERFAPLPYELFWYPYSSLKYNVLRRAVKTLYAPGGIAGKLRALLHGE